MGPPAMTARGQCGCVEAPVGRAIGPAWAAQHGPAWSAPLLQLKPAASGLLRLLCAMLTWAC